MDLFYIPSEKRVYILAAEGKINGFNHCLVKAAQFFTALKINVGCKLALVYAPVVGMAKDILDIREEAVDFPGYPIKGI